MRKLWFAHLARAIVAFPGGFGTFDELFELLTLSQTRKLARPIAIVLYGPDYWHEVVNFEALARFGMIARQDLDLFHFVDSPPEALAVLENAMYPALTQPTRAFARSVTPSDPEPPQRGHTTDAGAGG
jgi:hypothetical protein